MPCLARNSVLVFNFPLLLARLSYTSSIFFDSFVLIVDYNPINFYSICLDFDFGFDYINNLILSDEKPIVTSSLTTVDRSSGLNLDNSSSLFSNLDLGLVNSRLISNIRSERYISARRFLSATPFEAEAKSAYNSIGLNSSQGFELGNKPFCSVNQDSVNNNSKGLNTTNVSPITIVSETESLREKSKDDWGRSNNHIKTPRSQPAVSVTKSTNDVYSPKVINTLAWDSYDLKKENMLYSTSLPTFDAKNWLTSDGSIGFSKYCSSNFNSNINMSGKRTHGPLSRTIINNEAIKCLDTDLRSIVDSGNSFISESKRFNQKLSSNVHTQTYIRLHEACTSTTDLGNQSSPLSSGINYYDIFNGIFSRSNNITGGSLAIFNSDTSSLNTREGSTSLTSASGILFSTGEVNSPNFDRGRVSLHQIDSPSYCNNQIPLKRCARV